MRNHRIRGEHLTFERSCHTVQEAAEVANIAVQDLVKNICMIDSRGQIIVAIVKGEDRASTSRVGKALGIERPRIATPQEILETTEYPCGGVPSFGHNSTFLVDSRVMDKDIVYTSGGSERSLVRISATELQKANDGRIIRIRK